MTNLFIGAGKAGGAILDALFEPTDDSLFGWVSNASPDVTTLGEPLAINSTARDLNSLSNVPRSNRVGITEQQGLVPSTDPTFDELVTGGFGRNPTKADAVMDRYKDQIRDLLGQITGDRSAGRDPSQPDSGAPGSPAGKIDVAFLFAGLGGGTGCGIAPHIASQIKRYTDNHTQIVLIGVLPAASGGTHREPQSGSTEISRGRQAWNARYGLNRIEDRVEGIILVDNQRVSDLGSTPERFTQYNRYVVASLRDLVFAPALDGADAAGATGTATPDVYPRDIATSLSFGAGNDRSTAGYAAIGRAVRMTKSLSGYLLPGVGQRDIDAVALSRLSAAKQTIARVDSQDAQRALTLVKTPSQYLEAGSYGVETATVRRFLERQCNLSDIILGVALSNRALASVTTLFIYRRADIRRLAEIESIAAAYEESRERAAP